jgi:hypothetical protein
MYGEDNYVKRTQKSYSLQFKLQVVKEVESENNHKHQPD